MDKTVNDSNIKILKVLISVMILTPIFAVIIFYLWFCYEASKVHEYEEEKFHYVDTSNSELKKRIILADILNSSDEILITENNIDNTEKIIKNTDLTSGIYITENSRDKVQEILDEVIGKNVYKINDRGYLIILDRVYESDSITKFLDEKIDSNRLLIIDIADTYKGLLDNGAMLDVMVEQSLYAQTIVYNDNINICIFNSQKLSEKEQEGITIKEIYEEILLDMIMQKI